MKRSKFLMIAAIVLTSMVICVPVYCFKKTGKLKKKTTVVNKTTKRNVAPNLSTPERVETYFDEHDLQIPLTEAALQSNMKVAWTIAPSILKSFDVRFPNDTALSPGAKLIKYGEYFRKFMGEKAMTTSAMITAGENSIRYMSFVNAYLTAEILASMESDKERAAYYKAVLAGNKFLEESIGYIGKISSLQAYGGSMETILAANGIESAYDAWNEMIEKQVAIVRGDLIESGEDLPEHWQKYEKECRKSQQEALSMLREFPGEDYEGRTEKTVVQYVQQMDSLANNALSCYQEWIAESGLGGSGSAMERGAGTMLKEWQKIVKWH